MATDQVYEIRKARLANVMQTEGANKAAAHTAATAAIQITLRRFAAAKLSVEAELLNIARKEPSESILARRDRLIAARSETSLDVQRLVDFVGTFADTQALEQISATEKATTKVMREQERRREEERVLAWFEGE
jgi:mRNA-degrading endonuclease toxin of MazEF toxin-antitoxin module